MRLPVVRCTRRLSKVLRLPHRWHVLLAWIAMGWLAPANADVVRIDHYALELQPSLQTQSFSGTVTLHLTVGTPGVANLTLDAGALDVAAVSGGAGTLPFNRQGTQLRIELPERPAQERTLQVRIGYSGRASHGLRFEPSARQIATAFATSQWMPCLDDPAVRAGFSLDLWLPEDLASVGNGDGLGAGAPSGGLRRHQWVLHEPMPSYLYGFVAAPLRQVEQRAGPVQLMLAGPASFSAEDLGRVFADTADMMAFFERKSGVPYPLKRYSQVLLHGPAAQEMAGFSVMSVRYGSRVLEDPQAIWLGAHELAHQWWGNGLTNRAWTHFWLNEGIASFMTAAYLEHRLGRQAYLDLMALTRTKYEAVRDAGHDKSLVFADWRQPSAADRSLVYDKGALVLHALRLRLGEDTFWRALQHYTRKHWGQPVDTADFVLAMQESSGQDLGAFFDEWIGARR